MDWADFAIKILGFLFSWQTVAVGLVLLLRKSLIIPTFSLINRLAQLKFGSLQIDFVEATRLLVESKSDTNSGSKLTDSQEHALLMSRIIYRSPYYNLYANGLLVERQRGAIVPGANSVMITFPLAFPSEVLSIQVIGATETCITECTLCGCTISAPKSSTGHSFQLIITGI